MAERVRVQKAIAGAGLMSRRAAEDAIRAGRILLTGEPVVLGDRVDVSVDLLTLDGTPLPVDPERVTYLLNKPAGVVSTAKDPHGRPTVVELIDIDTRLYPVGRLDADSEGLILVTNDGELTNRVTHPRYGITKTYLALVAGVPRKSKLRELEAGVDLDDGRARAVSARMVEKHGDRSLVELVMVEGRNREVRRMMEAIGHEVDRLVRTAIGPLTAPDLEPSAYRRLAANEVRSLMEASKTD